MAELVQTPADVSGTYTDTGIAGVAIDAGMPIYVDEASSTLKKSQANAEATARCVGIALNSAAIGQPVAYQSTGDIDLGGTLVVGETYVVSDATAGKIMPIGDLIGTGDFPIILGIAQAADSLALRINESGVAKA